ncbi:MAG: VOC family protein [Pseudomonadales bacterium]|nr:VOC family protein [Pseudomonadales bacterium]
MKLKIDHIVVAADTLAQGISYIQQQFGVDVPLGGVHPSMGTHNALMQLADDLFFEIIAINPDSLSSDALQIQQPRWFSLDNPLLQKQLKIQPQLLTWVVNSDDIEQSLCQGIYQQTRSRLITRGDLSWHFAKPDDGSLIAEGLMPYVLQWHNPHPATAMPKRGCSLKQIVIYHPHPDWIEDELTKVGAIDLVQIESLDKGEVGYLAVEINTPNGLVVLETMRSSNF